MYSAAALPLMKRSVYDTVIIGSGIAGLYASLIWTVLYPDAILTKERRGYIELLLACAGRDRCRRFQ
jgi:aspartate oxidase